MSAWIALAARLLTGGVWVWAGAVKIGDPYASVQAVRAYQLLPADLAEVVGHLLPTLEVVVGIALIVGVLTRVSGGVSALLFVAFIVGIASVWARGIEIDCGCFGGGGAEAGASADYPWEIARDVGLLALSAFLAWRGGGRLALDTVLFRRAEDTDMSDKGEVEGDMR